MSAREVAFALGLAGLGVSLSGCNALTGADEPEIVDESVSAGAGLATSGGSSSEAGMTDASASGASSGAAGGAHDRDVSAGPETPAACGDGELGAGEQCDDGNATAGDGCSEVCHLECIAGEAARPPRGTCLAASVDDDRTWDDAGAACEERGGALVLLDDLDVSMFDGRLEGLHHVGARRADDGAFEWIDGSTVDEDLVIGDEDGSDCLAFDPASPPRLRAIACDDRLRYVCERDPGAGG